MEQKILDTILSMLQKIKAQDEELVMFLSQNCELTRDQILEGISQTIVNNRLSDLGFSQDDICSTDIKKREFEHTIDQIVANVEQDPSKKVLYLRDFFDLFEEISEQDKNVMLQSFKGVKLEDLKSKMHSFAKMLRQ